MKPSIFLVMVAVLLLQACAMGPSYTPMTPEARSSFDSVELYDLVIQDEVRPAVTMSNVTMYAGGGLIPALVDSSINKGRTTTAQDVIKPLYDVTGDLDYRQVLAENINTRLSEEFTIDNLKERAETTLLTDAALVDRIRKLEDGQAFLYLSSFYRFVDDSKALNTSTVAFLFTKSNTKQSTNSKKPPKPTYYNVFNYQSDSVGEGGFDSIAAWSEEQGARFRDEIQQSAMLTSEALAYDMQPTLDEACLAIVKTDFPSVATNSGAVQGKLISTQNERALIRDKNGILYSTNGTRVQVKPEGGKNCNVGGEA